MGNDHRLEDNLCKALGIDTKEIYSRLRLLEFKKDDKDRVEKLHKFVIDPHISQTVMAFYEYLLSHPQYREFVHDADALAKLARTFQTYLETLGRNYDSIDYFNHRLRVGVAHHRIGLPLYLYQCSYHKLRELLFKQIPAELSEELFEDLQAILCRVLALDESLAIDSYSQENVKGLKTEIKQLFNQEEKMKYYASIDPLTGVENRSAIIQRIKNIAKSKEDDASYVIVMIDIDNLREVNDVKGHLVGDYVIKHIAEKIKSELRKGDAFGRYGGDEFLLLLKGYSLDEGVEKVKDIQRVVTETDISAGNERIKITISQGVVAFDRSKKLVDIVKSVDKALIQAKHSDQRKIVVAK